MTDHVVLPFDALLKKCRECDSEKQLSEFHLDRRRLDGRHRCCAECNNRKRRDYRAGLTRPRQKGEAGHDYVALPDDDLRVAGRVRACKACGAEHPLASYAKNRGSKLGRIWLCQSCYAHYQECQKRKWRVRNREARRDRAYGASPAQVQSLFADQGGVCAICRNPLDPHAATTHVDHSHATGRVRGVLCRGCNQGLGKFRDDPSLLDAAAAYLRKGVADALEPND